MLLRIGWVTRFAKRIGSGEVECNRDLDEAAGARTLARVRGAAVFLKQDFVWHPVVTCCCAKTFLLNGRRERDPSRAPPQGPDQVWTGNSPKSALLSPGSTHRSSAIPVPVGLSSLLVGRVPWRAGARKCTGVKLYNFAVKFWAK